MKKIYNFYHSVFLRSFNYFLLNKKLIPNKIIVYDNEISISVGLIWMLVGTNEILIRNSSKTNFNLIKKNFKFLFKLIKEKEFDKHNIVLDKLNLNVYKKLFENIPKDSILEKRFLKINSMLDLSIKNESLKLNRQINVSGSCKNSYIICIDPNLSENLEDYFKSLKKDDLVYFFSSDEINKIRNKDFNDLKFNIEKYFKIDYKNTLFKKIIFHKKIKEITYLIRKK